MKTLTEFIRGMPKEVLEYLESNTLLANTAIDSHKKDFSNNIKYILVGFIFSIFGTITIETILESDTELMNKQLLEINASYGRLNIESQHMRLKIESLKTELDSLRVKK